MLNKERRRILNRMSDGALWDLFAWPITDIAKSLFSRARTHIAVGMLIGNELIQVVEETDEHQWAQITEKGRQALRTRDGN